MSSNRKPAARECGELSEVVRLQAERTEDSPKAQAEQQRQHGLVRAAARRLVGSVAFDGGEVRVTIATVRGVPSVDVRAFRPLVAHAPTLMAGGPGVSFPVGRAIDLAAMLVEAEDQARTMGLIGGDA